MLLSEETQNASKWKEAKHVFLCLFKPAEKIDYIALLKYEMREKRTRELFLAYKECTLARAITIPDNLEICFYQFHANRQWQIFGDKRLEMPLRFKAVLNFKL